MHVSIDRFERDKRLQFIEAEEDDCSAANGGRQYRVRRAQGAEDPSAATATEQDGRKRNFFKVVRIFSISVCFVPERVAAFW